MPPRPDDTPVLMPFIDRLTHLTTMERESREENLPPVRRMKRKVMRDLEWLFNTRANPDISPDFQEAFTSGANYGLPDISNLSMSNPRDRMRLEKCIETAIITFEPRLTGVRVKLVDQAVEGGKRVRFHVDALLKLDPITERISFDTELDVLSGQYEVKGDSSAG